MSDEDIEDTEVVLTTIYGSELSISEVEGDEKIVGMFDTEDEDK